MKSINFLFCLLLIFAPIHQITAQEINTCDIEAAHPSDPNHLGVGKSSSNVDTFAAISACREALEESPKNARFHYQLGRAMVYQGELEQGTAHVQHAADLNYMQAQFVLGLLIKDDDVCRAANNFKKAADQGLKAARITYLKDFLEDAYAGCAEIAKHEELTVYLNGAKSQVAGYYEGLLYNTLAEDLAARK